MTMKNHRRYILLIWIALISMLAVMPASSTMAQENPPPQPIDLPCVSDVSAQVLGMTPVNDGAQNLISARIIFAPGGSISAHTHPGSVVATIETGSLGFTHLGDAEMSLNRAATADTEAVVESLPHGEEVALNPGDWFVETGMIHTATNLSDGPTTVVLSAMIEAGQPLTICVEDATPVSHSS
jgi:quercetin dioxygenase-like cupin family protein